jgi:hypothetical protein
LDTLPAAAISLRNPPETTRERARWPRVEDRIIWLLDLFERLERREPPGSSAAS